MNLKQLEAFVKVAEKKSFSKAAKLLYLTQPTVSAHIAALEKELNARLFVRNTKEVNLSSDGQKLYQYARQMSELEKRISLLFADRGQEDNRCITIAASTIPAQYLLPEILSGFNEKYPGEQFQIIESDSAGVIEKVIDHTVDIGFTGTVLEKKHCKYYSFYKDELMVILPNTEKYQKLANSTPLESWIAREAFIMREEGSGTRKEAEKQLASLGVLAGQLNVVASMENPEAIKRSVMNGMGITIISGLAARQEMNDGKVIGIKMPLPGRDLNIVYNRNYPLSASTEKFIKTVKQMSDARWMHR